MKDLSSCLHRNSQNNTSGEVFTNIVQPNVRTSMDWERDVLFDVTSFYRRSTKIARRLVLFLWCNESIPSETMPHVETIVSSFLRGGPVKTGKRNVNRTPHSFVYTQRAFPLPSRKFVPLLTTWWPFWRSISGLLDSLFPDKSQWNQATPHLRCN